VLSKRNNLIVLDDIYPHLLSGFRIAEFNYYIEHIPDTKVFSSTDAFKVLNEKRCFDEVKKEFSNLYPKCTGHVTVLKEQPLKAKLIYMVFLHNAYNFLPYIEKYNIPFVFTLYPGGGFQLRQEHSDNMLRRVFLSPLFMKVIVTTKTTYDYLLNYNFCDSKKIQFVYGVVTQTEIFEEQSVRKEKFSIDKDTFDICFVAHKYTKEGRDKGYNIFIEVAKILSRLHNNIYFHVVGSFDESDVDISQIQRYISFYKTLKTHEFVEFHKSMDIILSPNSSFILSPGGFDGFPTGGCIEAGLNTVALFVTDDLNQNIAFTPNEDIVIISKDSNKIANQILYYYNRLDELYQLAEKGKNTILDNYKLEVQMKPRMEILTKYCHQ
jgi:glycosyltransferase involved in cell wall biosynthesis